MAEGSAPVVAQGALEAAALVGVPAAVDALHQAAIHPIVVIHHMCIIITGMEDTVVMVGVQVR